MFSEQPQYPVYQCLKRTVITPNYFRIILRNKELLMTWPFWPQQQGTEKV